MIWENLAMNPSILQTLGLNEELTRLHRTFTSQGFNLWFVGGCVRDALNNQPPKDIDLCTDATPDEQKGLYDSAGVRFEPTGEKHGTYTVILANGLVYEITSLRSETDHDGRYAVVNFERDLSIDLGRRDLTINAMAVSFDGEIIDLYGGREDLAVGNVRFVGNPYDRMREDYLRILRWLRFHGRFGRGQPLDGDAVVAAIANANGLHGISRERVWAEISKIISGPFGQKMMHEIMRLGLAGPISLPHGSILELDTVRQWTTDPVTCMVAFLVDPKAVQTLATDWKWSNAEANKANFLAQNRVHDDIDLFRLLVEGKPLDWVASLSMLQHRPDKIAKLRTWDIPVFPVRGQDLIVMGMKPGKAIGELLDALRVRWYDSHYLMTKNELLELAAPSIERTM